jgi:hypothetical protein
MDNTGQCVERLLPGAAVYDRSVSNSLRPRKFSWPVQAKRDANRSRALWFAVVDFDQADISDIVQSREQRCALSTSNKVAPLVMSN